MFNSKQLLASSLHGRKAFPFALLLSLQLVLWVCFTATACPSKIEGLDCLVGSSLAKRQPSHLLQSEDTGSQQQPFQLNLERKAFDDPMDALENAVHSGKIRMDRVRTTLKRRSMRSLSTLTPGTSNSSVVHPGTELASLVISGSSVGAGEYFVSLSVGTPPQKIYLIADTGSDLTWMKCFRCDGQCSTTNQSFNPASSSSFSPVSCLSSECSTFFFPPACEGLSRRCKFAYDYTDQSFATGSLVFESITLGSSSGNDVKVDNLLLGCGRQYAGPNFEKSGGVLGLGQGPLSLSSQLSDQSYANKFSYCLADFFGPSWISGSLAFGDTVYQTRLQYTPLLQNPFAQTFYYVGIEVIKVGGIALSIPAGVWQIDGQGNGGTIVDSGTTLAQFAQPAYEVIRAAFLQSVPYPVTDPIAGLDLCYNVSNIANLQFPELSITLGGNLIFQPPQDNYFTEATDGIKCLAMQDVPAPGFSVIGNLMQQNYHVEFDRVNNRLGLAPVDCSKFHS